MEKILTTAAGSIHCLRCTAHSTRTGKQCGRPALRSSKTQKCQFHGGRSTGPRTIQGKARIATAQTVHGRETKANRSERSAISAKLSQLEDAMRILGMTDALRCRGRKARGYAPIRTLNDVRQVLLNDLQNPVKGSAEAAKKIPRKTHHP